MRFDGTNDRHHVEAKDSVFWDRGDRDIGLSAENRQLLLAGFSALEGRDIDQVLVHTIPPFGTKIEQLLEIVRFTGLCKVGDCLSLAARLAPDCLAEFRRSIFLVAYSSKDPGPGVVRGVAYAMAIGSVDDVHMLDVDSLPFEVKVNSIEQLFALLLQSFKEGPGTP